LDPLPDHLPPRESVESDPELAARYPLALISPPARNFLNSSFANVSSLVAIEREPRCEIHPGDAQARGIADGDRVAIFNDRGRFIVTARVSERIRPGVLLAWGLWWPREVDGGRNVNAVTSTAITDLGRGPTFYDCLVEVAPLAQ
jgi:anaerobic selenocysteine-containing dehydrogenase